MNRLAAVEILENRGQSKIYCARYRRRYRSAAIVAPLWSPREVPMARLGRYFLPDQPLHVIQRTKSEIGVRVRFAAPALRVLLHSHRPLRDRRHGRWMQGDKYYVP
jgi:hypothetical protein